MGDLSFGEIFVIVLVIIILFGPDKIPGIARDMGQAVRKMRGAVDDIKSEIMKEADNPVQDIKKEIEKVRQSVSVDPLDMHASRRRAEEAERADSRPVHQKDDDEYEGPVSR